ncbi:Response regulator receiver domain-containing protein [Dyadobacter soli]|uniref:Response regulator receiver domain-containing protein n=1 Tax=Dyadobacter soli TaxID=659014 RepID=A0A1G6ZP55_9BACT|nr:response regulator [Dyadobacter soli]SDE04330.1 Response regulator receiver domain-containing protein [Dyadobacter soli]
MATSKKITVLYVDDEIHNLNSFKATFRKEFEVITAGSAAEALEILQKDSVHIVITDHRMPGMTGVDFLIRVLEMYPDVMRVLLTGFAELTAVAEALSRGQVHYRMEKPWDEEQIRVVINASYEISLLRMKGGQRQDVDVASELEFILRQNLLS